jgi:hypothetical protein
MHCQQHPMGAAHWMFAFQMSESAYKTLRRLSIALLCTLPKFSRCWDISLRTFAQYKQSLSQS